MTHRAIRAPLFQRDRQTASRGTGADIDAAIGALVAVHYARLLRLARLICRDSSDAADAVHLALTESPQGPPGQRKITPVLELMSQPTWQHTLFAPTDASFTALPPATLETLMTDAGARLDFVRFHISQRVWAAADLLDDGMIETPGGRVEVSRDGQRVMVGEAVITEADVAATNGVVQVFEGFVGLPD